MTVKSPSCVPPIDTVPTVKAAVPLLAIVKVSLIELPTAVLPKAVSLIALVVIASIGDRIAAARHFDRRRGGHATDGEREGAGRRRVVFLKLTVAVRVPPAVGAELDGERRAAAHRHRAGR